jgi:transcription antitermination factor NusG
MPVLGDDTYRSDPWYALHTRSNFEQITACFLRERDYPEFVPTYKVRTRWSDRTGKVERPLFPGYLFCRFPFGDRSRILAAPGVVHIVGAGKVPVPVEQWEIEAVQIVLRSGIALSPWRFLHVGQRVLIGQGPLAGLEGILVSFKGGFRVVVSVTLLQRSIAAEVDGDWIRAIGFHRTYSLSPELIDSSKVARQIA